MTIHLDHTIIPSRNQIASAKRLAELLGVPWAETALGPFSPVHVNDGWTLDVLTTDEAFPIYHFCFRVEQKEFDAILERFKRSRYPVSRRGAHRNSRPQAQLNSVTNGHT